MKNLIYTFSFFFAQLVLACPMCGGVDQDSSDTSIVSVLAIFVALTYIPYLIIFRLIKKYQRVNQVQDHVS